MIYRFFSHWRSSFQGIPHQIWFLSAISLVNRCGSMVIAFITLYLTQSLGFGIKEAGYIMTFFGAGALIGSYIGGRLTDRLGSFPVQFWSLMINGVILILMLEVREFWTMCASVFLMSLAAEVFRPANSVAIATYCTPETRTRSISLYRMAVNLGWAVAPAFGGLMVALGWPWLFWVDGLTCMGAALLLYVLLGTQPVVSKETKAPDEDSALQRAGNSPYRDRLFLWFALLTMLNVMVFMQFLWTVPVFWKEHYGWSETQVGLMSAVNGFLVFLIEMPLIFQLEGKKTQLQYVRFGLLLYALSYLFFLLPVGYFWAGLLYVTAISFGEMFVMPFSSNFVFGRSSGAFQGQYMAMYGIAWAAANMVAPFYGTQIIAAWGYHVLWTVLAVQALLVGLGFVWLERSLHQAKEANALSGQAG